MRSAAACVVVLACLAATASAQTTAHRRATWPMFHYSLDHLGVNDSEHVLKPGNVSRLHVVWQARFKAPTQEGIFNSSIAVGKRAVYVGSEKPRALFAFQRGSGKLLWKASTSGAVESSPAIRNGCVYVGSGDGHLYSFNARTGKRVWRTDVGFDVASSSPTVWHGTVYIGSQQTLAGDDRLYALSAHTGHVKWWADLGVAPGQAFASAASIVGKTLFIGTETGEVLAFPASCSTSCVPRQQYFTGQTAEMSTSAVTAHRIFVSGSGNSGTFVYAFPRSCGGLTCDPLWKGEELTPFTFSTPAVADGLVYVQGYKLYAFPRKCRHDGGVCKPRWKASLRGFAASPAVANGVVYAGSITGKLYAFGAKCGRSGKRCRPRYASAPIKGGGGFASSPAVVGGRVYYGGFNRVHAFALRARH